MTRRLTTLALCTAMAASALAASQAQTPDLVNR